MLSPATMVATTTTPVEHQPVHPVTEALPQPLPAPTPSQVKQPSYSTLPSWLAEPYVVSAAERGSFPELGVDAKLVSLLDNVGYTTAFPVQCAVLRLLNGITGEAKKDDDDGNDDNGAYGIEKGHRGDLCISAATGSGKTLAYALPLVSNLRATHAPISRLRGLIVVPTRELVRQARDACETTAAGTGLKIGTAVGSAALKDEQAALMVESQAYDPIAFEGRQQQVKLGADEWTGFNLQQYIHDAIKVENELVDHVTVSSTNIDILVCTPGRLVDHIRSTRGFSLRHLEWLVIDEADRLLNESFQDWVDVVIPALEEVEKVKDDGLTEKMMASLGYQIHRPRRLRKIILSATMTRDVEKLSSLRLENPKLVVVGKRPHTKQEPNLHEEDTEMADASEIEARTADEYALPATLNEYSVPVGDGSDKPLYLLALLLRLRVIDSNSTALVFAKSSESASRLSRLLIHLEPSLAECLSTLTKTISTRNMRSVLSSYRNGNIKLIIATDRASRGLDLPALDNVICYDVPASVTAYVHRVGRTARAGRTGHAWTLVAKREGRWFSKEIGYGVGAQDNEHTDEPTPEAGTRAKIVREEGKKLSKATISLDEGEINERFGGALKEKYIEALAELRKDVTTTTKK